MKTVVITHLYPSDMSIYGDIGNVITMRKRLEWRGYDVRVEAVEVGTKYDFKQTDIVFGGGGQDSGQLVVGEDLLKRGELLAQLAAEGVPMLTICGTYQLFGRGFITMEGQEIPGIGIFKATTHGSTVRMIGNIAVETDFGTLVGFENHSGQTILEAGQAALGRVKKGFGNNDSSQMEGAATGNVFGTYMHGPLLPKNPKLADHLIKVALERRFGQVELKPIDDQLERAAAVVAYGRPQ